MCDKPKIICAGMLNTKGEEMRFLAREVERAGGEPSLMDLGLGVESSWADLPLSAVLARTGVCPAELFALDRASASEVVAKAGARTIDELYRSGRVDGIIAWAGGVGTTVATAVMRALPIGVPKIMLSTLASGDVSRWVGNKDIYMVNPISEKGINRVTRRIIANAAAAIVAMGRLGPDRDEAARPLVALTAYGTTTPTVARCQKHMEENGWDTIVIHQVGTGATMEDLIRSGHITAVFDITTGELSNTLLGSIYGMPKGWAGDRLTAASELGIPQIVCPGGLEQCAWGPPDRMPQRYVDETKSGKRASHLGSGTPFVHNAEVSILAPTEEEQERLALEMITKLNAAKGPTALVVPMRGWSAYDQPARVACVERGWSADHGDAPMWLPDPDHPDWSKRARIAARVFERVIDRANPHLDLILLDLHILDEQFAEFLIRCMDDMLAGRWCAGKYRDDRSFVRGGI